jgi:hypothetical protein
LDEGLVFEKADLSSKVVYGLYMDFLKAIWIVMERMRRFGRFGLKGQRGLQVVEPPSERLVI